MTIPITEVHKYLQDRIREQENILFGLAQGNDIGGANEYLFDTPHGYWNTTTPLPDNHSKRLPDKIFALLNAADHWIDIVTMNPPNDDFLQAIIGGIGRAKMRGKGNRVTVRILMGSVPPLRINTDWIRDRIEDGLKAYPLPPGGVHPNIFVAQLRWKVAGSWNHAKIIAVDGKKMMVGGHNMWTEAYLKADPVFDLSLCIDGPIARSGHVFANGLWAFVKKNNSRPFSETYSSCMEPQFDAPYHLLGHAPDTGWSPPEAPVNVGTLPALWVTNAGWGVFKEGDGDTLEGSGLIAFVRALKNARHCRLSQQDLGSRWETGHRNFSEHALPGLPYRLITYQGSFFNLSIMDNLAEYLLRDPSFKLEMVLTTPENRSPPYTNFIPLSHNLTVLGHRLAHLGGLNKDQVLARLKDQVTLKNIHFHEKNRPNHAKFWMIDDLTYVGSENLYPPTRHFFTDVDRYASLQEFGVITETTPAVKEMILKNYFEPMFSKGRQTNAVLADLNW